jgi:hypothetical protein
MQEGLFMYDRVEMLANEVGGYNNNDIRGCGNNLLVRRIKLY